MRIRNLSAIIAASAITLAACGGSDDSSATTAAATTEAAATQATESADTMAEDDMSEDTMAKDSMAEDSMADDSMADDSMADDSMTDDSMTDAEMAEHEDDAEMADGEMADGEMAGPAFTHVALTDVNGEAFTLADFMGEPVFVETFATWCPKCQSQLEDTNAAAGEVGDAAEFIALSVETDIDSAAVASYAADNGFENVRFAVVTPEFLAAITEHYGTSAANPPGTPHFIINSHGEAGELLTGTESSADIVAAVQAAA